MEGRELEVRGFCVKRDCIPQVSWKSENPSASVSIFHGVWMPGAHGLVSRLGHTARKWGEETSCAHVIQKTCFNVILTVTIATQGTNSPNSFWIWSVGISDNYLSNRQVVFEGKKPSIIYPAKHKIERIKKRMKCGWFKDSAKIPFWIMTWLSERGNRRPFSHQYVWKAVIPVTIPATDFKTQMNFIFPEWVCKAPCD